MENTDRDQETKSTSTPREDEGHAAAEGAGGPEERRHRRQHRHRRRHRHGERKEKVLHTRVSEQLSDDIRRLAEDLRVPASNLVRNVLEEVFAAVENVSDDFGDLFEDFVEEAEATRDRLRHARRGGRRRHARRGSRRPGDADVEAELSEDERREFGDPGRPAPESEAEASQAEPAEEPAPNPFPDVLGWQPLVLNHTGTCAQCGVGLSRGQRAFVGLTAQGLSGVTLCRACVGS